MLNEFYEIKQYTCNPTEYSKKYDKYRRIRLEKKEPLGVRRALLIIARNELHKYDNIYSDAAIYAVMDCMKEWLSTDSTSSSIYSNWLHTYIASVYSTDISAKLKNMRSRYAYDSMSIDPAYEKSNNVNAIHFDDIICEAQELGELKKYYLLASNLDEIHSENDIWENIYVYSATNPQEPTLLSEHRKRVVNKRIILKMLSAYLLDQRKGYENRHTAKLYLSDVSNWVGSKLDDNGKDSVAATEKYYYRAPNRLFNKENINNLTLLSINPDWLEKCGWKLVDDQELDQFLSNHASEQAANHIVYYADSENEKLLLNERY